MADYTVIVDDSDVQIIYGPGADSWSPSDSNHVYQGTVHQAITGNANMTFSFVGGREVIIRGNFVGDNDASDSATYPVFQVDSKNFNCGPNPPQNGGQFLCSTTLPSKVTNRTLFMFVDPNAAIQQFHIDYIRHGSSSQAAQAADGTVVFVLSPDNRDPNLNDIKSAMQTSTPSSKATYRFFGDSFAWWGCCMPPGTSSNAANVTYSIDASDVVPVQIDEKFIQGARCKDERILFQTQPGQLQPGDHNLEVVYHGDGTKMPLTLCGLAAVPLNFSALDIQPPSSTPPLPSSTNLPSTSPSQSSSGKSSDHGKGPIHSLDTGIIVGIISGVVLSFIILAVSIIWWWRKRATQRAQEKRSSSTDSLLPFVFHPVVGFIDLEKRSSLFVPSSGPSPSLPASATAPSNMPAAPPMGHEQDERKRPRSTESLLISSPLELRPPSYRTTGSLLNS